MLFADKSAVCNLRQLKSEDKPFERDTIKMVVLFNFGNR